MGTEKAGDRKLLSAWPAYVKSMGGKDSSGEIRNQGNQEAARALLSPLSVTDPNTAHGGARAG